MMDTDDLINDDDLGGGRAGGKQAPKAAGAGAGGEARRVVQPLGA